MRTSSAGRAAGAALRAAGWLAYAGVLAVLRSCRGCWRLLGSPQLHNLILAMLLMAIIGLLRGMTDARAAFATAPHRPIPAGSLPSDAAARLPEAMDPAQFRPRPGQGAAGVRTR